jgi:hypothetical protein
MEYILINFMQGEISKMWPLIWQYIHIMHRYSVCGAFHQQYILRFNKERCVFLLFYVLMKHIILYVWIQWCNKDTQILLTPPPPPPFNKFHALCKGEFQKCDHWFGNTFTFCTDIPFAVHFNCANIKKCILTHLKCDY